MPGLRLDIEVSAAKRKLNAALAEMRAAASVPIEAKLKVDISSIKRAKKEIAELRREMANVFSVKDLDANARKNGKQLRKEVKSRQSRQPVANDSNIKAASQQVKDAEKLAITLQNAEKLLNKGFKSFEKTLSNYGLLNDPKYSKMLKEVNAFAEKIRGETANVKSKEALGLPLGLKSYYDDITKQSKKFVSDMGVIQSRIDKSIDFRGLTNHISEANKKLNSASDDYNAFIREYGNKVGDSDAKNLRQKIREISDYQSKVTDAQKALDDPFSIDRDKEKYFNNLSDSAGKAADKIVGDMQKIKNSLDSIETQEKNMRTFDKLGNRLTSYFKQYGAQIMKNQELLDKFNSLMFKLNNGQFASATEANNAFASFRMDARRAGVEVDTLGAKLEKTFGARLRSALAGEGVAMISIALRDIVQNAIDVDTAMTELKKVTDLTDTGYVKFLDDAGDRASKLGATLTEVVNATADYARLGFSVPEAKGLADSALIYNNVGDDLESIDDATSHLISTMQGFGIASEDSMKIVDKFNEVSNKFPSSAGDIGAMVMRSASAMAAANNDLDETIALGVTANTVVQDADVVGEKCA